MADTIHRSQGYAPGAALPLAPWRRSLWQYAIAILAVGLGVAVKLALASVLSAKASYILLIPPVLIASAVGGWGPGLLATALGLAFGLYLADRPLGTDDFVQSLLFALAGIPITSGFTGKFAVFSAAIGGNATFLVVVALVTSAIAAFFYVKIVVLMFFQEPRAEGPVVVRGSVLTYAAVGVGIAVTLMLGIYPQPVLDLAREAAQFGFVS